MHSNETLPLPLDSLLDTRYGLAFIPIDISHLLMSCGAINIES